jgi:hypothetical protein
MKFAIAISFTYHLGLFLILPKYTANKGVIVTIKGEWRFSGGAFDAQSHARSFRMV